MTFTRWSLLAGLACLTCLSARAAEYCLRPAKGDGTCADNVVCCTTPSGWQGWKDYPDYQDRIKRLDAFSTLWLRRSISFSEANCEKGTECAYLALDTRDRDSRGQPDIETGLRDFVDQLEQSQDPNPHEPRCVVVNRFGAFDTQKSGTLTIWRLRCPSGSGYFVTLLTQSDVLVTIHLRTPDTKGVEPKIDKLKELARSVRISDASVTLPDIVEIDAARFSDEAIRQELMQLTPVGTRTEKVQEILEWRLRLKGNQPVRIPRNLHRANDDLYTVIGSYPNPGPFATVVEACWKFDKQHKLRDVEIREHVIEYKAERAIPVNR